MSLQQMLQQNAMARAAVLQTAVPMKQRIATETIASFSSASPVTRNIALRNVGLTRRLYLDIVMTVAQAAAETLTRSPLGPSNILSNIQLADYSNYQRINTTGWHLDKVATAKNRAPFGAAFTTDTPNGYGSNFNVITAPSTITTAQTVRMIYEIPLAYSDVDLRGALLTNVFSANAYLQFTFNPQMIVSSSGNNVNCVYKSSSADVGLVTNITWTLYQDYLDQLPASGGQLILPAYDLSNIYGLYNTVLAGIAVNQDNPINYVNYRDYYSTTVVYDNAGVLNAGTDMNSIKLQSANMTNIFDLPPRMLSLFARRDLMDDPPLGTYYVSHRDKPISSVQNGNMQLLLNPSTVTSSASQFLVGFEYIGLINQLAQAGSVLQ